MFRTYFPGDNIQNGKQRKFPIPLRHSVVQLGAAICIIVAVCCLAGTTLAQSTKQSSYTVPNAGSLNQANLVPLVPFGNPDRSLSGSQPIAVSDSWLGNWKPRIPNLEFGFSYLFGNNLRQSRWIADYLYPVTILGDDALFGEIHAESLNSDSRVPVPFLNNFWNQTPPGAINRSDLSVGAGYRKLFQRDFLLGMNAFWDGAWLFGTGHSSLGLGFEMAANGPGDSLTDLTFNYYSNVYGDFNSRGSVFPTFNLIDDIRNGRGNFDLEFGYSQPLFDRALDLRIKFAGYQFDYGNHRKPGFKTGADITTANGAFRLSLDYGWDGVTGTYGAVTGYVYTGFQVENLVKGQSPFDPAPPVFRSPRNLSRLLTLPVRRDWHKPSGVVANPRCKGLPDDSMFQVPYGKACFYTGYPIAEQQCHAVGRYTISDTPGQHWVVDYDKDWLGPPYDYNRDIKPIDQCMSAAFARAAEGDVIIYVRCGNDPVHNPGSVLWTTELPTLLSNSNVTSIKAYDNCACPGGGWCHEVIYK